MKHILFHYETSELQENKSYRLQQTSYRLQVICCKLLNISALIPIRNL
jgi:hypothetical protein